MSKNIDFKATMRASTPDEFVAGRAEPSPYAKPAPAPTRPAPAPPAPPRMKRFTIDVPMPLHIRIKIQCARRGLKMADVLRDLLEREFPE